MHPVLLSNPRTSTLFFDVTVLLERKSGSYFALIRGISLEDYLHFKTNRARLFKTNDVVS